MLNSAIIGPFPSSRSVKTELATEISELQGLGTATELRCGALQPLLRLATALLRVGILSTVPPSTRSGAGRPARPNGAPANSNVPLQSL